jgi:hypothetical protein
VTKKRLVGAARLLVIDGHESHNSLEFQQYCKDNKIITLCMPPHLSHLLQPLDVGCFSPLKKAYGRQAEDLIRNHINHITKIEFLPCFIAAFHASITKSNIQGGFRGAGLVPLDLEAVISNNYLCRGYYCGGWLQSSWSTVPVCFGGTHPSLVFSVDPLINITLTCNTSSTYALPRKLGHCKSYWGCNSMVLSTYPSLGSIGQRNLNPVYPLVLEMHAIRVVFSTNKVFQSYKTGFSHMG